MKNYFFWLILLFGLSSLSAQSYSKHFAMPQNDFSIKSDSLKILAVMVDFQEDKYDGTIGSGKFGSHYSKNYGDTILDPLPHDANYFSDHLLFAKNYFQKASKGKLNISYKVLPEVITVSKTMREYSPGYQSKDLKPLANLSEEVWKLADQKFSNIDFSKFDLFIIFHAGVSSGLDLGIFSIDRNLPSLYLSNNSFKQIYGNQFSGFATKSGLIKNTMILPETESRELQMIDNSVSLLQITINGALVANIASHLGLPDLFDTETGKSAIGRFGLMDGQAIIANNGMFPPSLSAWEKIFLGWDKPIEISNDANRINVKTNEIAKLTDTTIVKIPINSSEYYLIENRQQDALKNNLVLTIKKGNEIFKQTILPDTSGLFYLQPKDIDGGVIIDVDEFDAAVPGNGIVIWHIDEKIIDQKISENKINADLFNKGVDVEEADGIQDIGEIFYSPFGTIIGEGTQDDFWFAGNKAKFYKNSFSPTSKPNTNSNSGANSFITIDSFSANGNSMSFNVSFGKDGLKSLIKMKLPLMKNGKHELLALTNNFTYDLFILDGSDLVKVSSEGKIINRIKNFSDENRIAGVFYEGVQYVFGVYGDTLKAYSFNLSNNEEKFSRFRSLHLITTPLVLINTTAGLHVFAGTQDGYNFIIRVFDLFKYDLATVAGYQQVTKSPVVQIVRQFDTFNNSYYSVISGNEFYQSINNNIAGSLVGNHKRIAVVQDFNGDYINIILSDADGKKHFDIIKNNNVIKSFDVYSESPGYDISVADLFNDGRIFIIQNDVNKINVYDLNGSMLEKFPIQIASEKIFAGSPLITDIDKDGIQEILISNNKGELFAINPKDGKMLDGFPIQIGSSEMNIQLFNLELPTMGPIPTYKPLVATIDNDNFLSIWNLSNMQGKSSWISKYGNASNNSFIKIDNQPKILDEYFPVQKAYNWPNPVYGNSTNISYYVSEDSKVTIRIFDLSGSSVATIYDNAKGGFENETKWDVSNIQSGIYYANILVESISGKSATKNIKIAVIK